MLGWAFRLLVRWCQNDAHASSGLGHRALWVDPNCVREAMNQLWREEAIADTATMAVATPSRRDAGYAEARQTRCCDGGAGNEEVP